MDRQRKSSIFRKYIALVLTIIVLCGVAVSSALFSDRTEGVSLSVVAGYPSYIVTYDANGGAFDSETENKVEYEDGVIISGEYKEPTHTNEGLYFDGWYTDPELSDGKEFDKDNDVKSLKENITVYAKWSPITYKIRYNANGGEGTMDDSEHVYDVEKELSANEFSKTGYDFIGWSDTENGNIIYTDKEVVKNLTTTNGATIDLYAVWKVKQYTYNIIYKTESGIELGTGTVTNDYGAEQTIYPKDFEGYKKPDPQLVKWDSTTPKTIIFIYTPIEYTINYVLNGGTVATANPTTYTIETETFTLNNPTREGYDFIGWTGSNGTTPSTSVSVEKGSTGNKEFTANWEAIPILRSWTYDSEDDFHNSAYRSKITTAELVDKATVPDNAIGPWDVSAYNNNSVQAWLVQTATDDESTTNVDETAYHLTIAGNGYGKVFANPDSSNAFYNFENMSTFTGLNILDTVNTEYMDYMFAGCEKVTGLDVANWNTEKVKSLSYAFAWCQELPSLDVSNWKTPALEDMSGTFYDCWELESLNLEGWDVADVKYMSLTFGTDLKSSLTTIGDVSQWNTSNVETMALMFYDCYSLLSVDVSQWNVANVTDMESMFYGCNSLTVLDVSRWNVSKVECMSEMFRSCEKLSVIDISGWNCSSLDYTTYNGGNNGMFQNCDELTELTIPASMSHLGNGFARYCEKLSKITFMHTAEDALTLAGAGSNSAFRVSEPYSSVSLMPTTVVTNNDTIKAIFDSYEWGKDFRELIVPIENNISTVSAEENQTTETETVEPITEEEQGEI